MPSLKSIIPHVLVVLGFMLISFVYFTPVLKGKQILQSDIIQHTGMYQQQKDYTERTGKESYWTNSGYSGMPTYQLGAKYPHNYIKKLDLLLRFLPRPVDYLFLYFLGFYILLCVLKLDFRLAALGALAFGFSTYLIILLGVGHNSKANAIAYMPLVLSGIILTFRKHYVYGFLLTTIAMGLELVANHYQMTYYLMFLVIILGLVYFREAYKKQILPHFFKSLGILVAAVVLAIGLNATNILATQEYVKESKRSKSELTIDVNGKPKEDTSGLNREYITEYSYGILESFNLFIPRLMGGGMYEDVGGKDSNIYKYLRQQNVPMRQAKEFATAAPTYWGDQPLVEAPAYVGAVVLFLFVLSLFLVKGRLKYWIVGGVIFSLLMSYGKNIPFLTDFFIDYFPLYNKFRAVSSMQVILELCIPVLAIFGISQVFNDFNRKEYTLKALYYTLGITGGITLMFLIFKSTFFDFAAPSDVIFRERYGSQFVDALRLDRSAIFTKDALRSLILVLLSGAVIFGYIKEKLSENIVIISFAVLIVFDLVSVDRRYVNTENFVSAQKVNTPYAITKADTEILKDKSYYRVYDLLGAGSRASFFHNSLDGYHAAKLRRYNELYDYKILKNNTEVINMLNTKYIIAEGENGEPFPFLNEEANGHAWFVSELKAVDTADEEITSLDTISTEVVAVTSQDIQSKTFKLDSLASIKLVDYELNKLVYNSKNNNPGLAVFSEIYYKHGWQAYIDDVPVPHFRVNYVLRALEIPEGDHKITFVFDPKVVKTGSTIALLSSMLLLGLIISGLFVKLKSKRGA